MHYGTLFLLLLFLFWMKYSFVTFISLTSSTILVMHYMEDVQCFVHLVPSIKVDDVKEIMVINKHLFKNLRVLTKNYQRYFLSFFFLVLRPFHTLSGNY